MKKETKHARVLSARQVRSFAQKTLITGMFPDSFDLEEFSRGRPSLIRNLPLWVGRYGLITGDGQYLFWSEPIESPKDTFPSQAVIDVPRGRYMIDTLDTASSRWVSRESAEGGPLVIGLAYTGHPVLLWIHTRID